MADSDSDATSTTTDNKRLDERRIEMGDSMKFEIDKTIRYLKTDDHGNVIQDRLETDRFADGYDFALDDVMAVIDKWHRHTDAVNQIRKEVEALRGVTE